MLTRGLSFAAGFLLCGAIASYFKTSDNLKPVALNFILMSSTAIAVNEFGIMYGDSHSKNREDDLKEEIKSINRAKADLQLTYNSQSAKLKELSNTVDDQLKQIAIRDEAVRTMQQKITGYKDEHQAAMKNLADKLKLDDVRFQESLNDFKDTLIEDIEPRIDVCYSGLQKTIEKLLNDINLSNFRDNLQISNESLIKFRAKLQISYESCIELYEQLRVADDLLECIDIIFEITTKMSSIKVQYRNTLNIGVRLQLDKAFEILGENDEKMKVFRTFKDAYRQSSDQHKSDLENFLYKVQDSQNSLQEMREQVGDLIAEIEAKNLKINEMSAEIEELKKPIQFLGASEYAQAGNSISMYYYKLGYRLDCINWAELATGYTITFAIRKNQGLTIDELYVKNSREQLAAFTNALVGTLPEFELNYQHGLATLTVQQRKAIKQSKTQDEINKIWIPASKFESYVKTWERVRITAGSTGGKSPTAKNLALAIMKSRKGQGDIKLYDPQHGSKKDFWNMPKFGFTHEDSLEGMREACNLIDERRHGKDHRFRLYIFDEVDNTVTNLKEGAVFKDLIKILLKEGSHASIGAIFIGQSCDANEVPGMTDSNWNNAIHLHIGANAGKWLNKATAITSEEKTRLLEQYSKIQDFCDRKNEELGLDIFTDATAYRFALAVPLSGLPRFIQLPDFDTYDYDDVMSTNTRNNFIPNNSNWVEIKPQNENLAVKIACPHCGSTEYRSQGDRWKCKNPECNKTWVK